MSDRAVREFNQLSRRHGLGVTFSATTSQNANVVVNRLSGQGSFSYGGATHQVTLPAGQMIGLTWLVRRQGGAAGDRVEKAYVYLPAEQHINTPQDRVRRTGATRSGYMPPLMMASDTQTKVKSVW